MLINGDQFEINPDMLNQIFPGLFTAINELWNRSNVGMNWAGLIIVCLLIEYCLKYILQSEGKSVPTSGKAGHNMQDLFSKISKERKQQIQKEIDNFALYFGQSRINYETNAKEIIKKHATLFNDWRYGIIDKTSSIDTANINFIELRLILIALINNTDIGMKISLNTQDGKYTMSYNGGQNIGMVIFN